MSDYSYAIVRQMVQRGSEDPCFHSTTLRAANFVCAYMRCIVLKNPDLGLPYIVMSFLTYTCQLIATRPPHNDNRGLAGLVKGKGAALRPLCFFVQKA
jgi:hypothetical protein